MNLFKLLSHRLRFGFFISVLWLSTITGFSQSPVLTNAAIVSGNFQFQVLTASNTTFTIETSPDLIGWTAVGSMTSISNSITVVDPRGTAGFNHLFYRILLGSVASFNLGFLEFADAGGFGDGFAPATTFPVTVNSYSATFGAKGDTDFPAANNIFFSGPAGSGLTNSPANPDNSNTNGTKANFQSQFVSNPVFPPGGVWTVNYKGTNQTFNISTPPDASHIVVPSPTVTVSGGVLQSVSWVYRDAVTGATLAGPPAYVSNIQIQVHGDSAANELYDSDQLTPATTSNVLTTPVTWSDVSSISMAYEDSNGNNYVISFSGPVVGP